MNSANVQKLGNIQPGVIDTSAASTVYNKLRPIVLWSAADISSALYVHVQVGERRRSLLERIDHIDKKSGGKLGLFRSGDFPITFRGTIPTNETEDATEAFDEDYMLTADINGDDVDELILPRHQGIVEVYNAEKRLFSFEIPSKKSKRPINEVIYSFRARAKGHEVIYLIFELQDESDGSESEQRTHVDLSERYTILRIDESGINTIILKDMGFNVSKILALGALNKPGSSGIDELIVCSMREEEGERKFYMSRHRPDGEALAPPRKVYVEMDEYGLQFIFLPQSDQAVIFEPEENIYFVSPTKPANWIRLISIQKWLTPGGDFSLLGVLDPDSNPKAQFIKETNFYAVDQEGIFYKAANGNLVPATGPAPLRELQLDSPQHQFVGVYPLPNEPDYLLAMQSRDPQARKLTDDEIEKAAKQFLPQDRLAAIEEASILEFDVISSLVEDEKKRKNVTADIRSLKDFEQYLPEFYRELKEIRTQYKRGSMESELLNPIVGAFGSKPFSPQHTAWLEGVLLPPEISVQVIRRGVNALSFKLSGYFSEIGPPDASGPARPVWRMKDQSVNIVDALQTWHELGQKPELGYYAVSR